MLRLLAVPEDSDADRGRACASLSQRSRADNALRFASICEKVAPRGVTKSSNLAEHFMSNETRSDHSGSASRLQQVIDQQAAEIEALRARLVDDRFAQELRRALIDAAAAGTIAAPLTHSLLLEPVVQTSMPVV